MGDALEPAHDQPRAAIAERRASSPGCTAARHRIAPARRGARQHVRRTALAHQRQRILLPARRAPVPGHQPARDDRRAEQAFPRPDRDRAPHRPRATWPCRPASRFRCTATARALWRQGRDTGGDIDVAVIEIERAALPKTSVYRAFTPAPPAGSGQSGGTRLLAAGGGLSAGLPRRACTTCRWSGTRSTPRPSVSASRARAIS